MYGNLKLLRSFNCTEHKNGYAFIYSTWPTKPRLCELNTLETVKATFTLIPVEFLLIFLPEEHRLHALIQNGHRAQIYKCSYSHDDTPYLILVSEEMYPSYGTGLVDILTDILHPTNLSSPSPADVVKTILDLCHGDVIAMAHLGSFVIQELFKNLPIHVDCMRLALSMLKEPKTITFTDLPRKMPPLEPLEKPKLLKRKIIKKSALELHTFALPPIPSKKWKGKTVAKFHVYKGIMSDITHQVIVPSKKKHVPWKEIDLYYTYHARRYMSVLRRLVKEGHVYRCYMCQRKSEYSVLIIVKRSL
jgi:hypothetical protein